MMHLLPWEKFFREKKGALLLFGLLCFGLLFLVDPALAASDKKGGMDWVGMSMRLLGGLAIFLFGMEMMSEALRKVAGDRMRDILARLTTNPVAGVVTGAFTTAIIQSSSVTTVIVVGFVTAGLMNLTQAIGVIFGANIGTTITAQIVAFKVTQYAMMMIAGGFLMWILSKNDRTKQWGYMLMGLGLVFHGMDEMSHAMKPLRSFQPFLDLMQSMSNPIMGILVATGFTALIQSSSATTSIVIVMAGQGLVPLEAGIALAFGANIGTCATALLACIGKTREAVQASVAHLLFNVIGVIIWTPFISQLIEVVTWLSPVADPTLTGLDLVAAEVPRQIANAHTVFNLVNALIFLPFTVPYAKLVRTLVKERPVSVADTAAAAFRPQFLDDGMLSTHSLALSMVRREASRMGGIVEKMLAGVPESVFHGKEEQMVVIRDMDNQVDILYGEISKYLARIGRQNLSEKDAEEAMSAMTATTELENIGDIIEVHMFHIAKMVASSSVTFDATTMGQLNQFHQKLAKAYHSMLLAFEQNRPDAAKVALQMEKEIVDEIDLLVVDRYNQLLNSPDPAMHRAFTLENDILENYKRIYLHIKRVARLVLHQEGSTALVAV